MNMHEAAQKALAEIGRPTHIKELWEYIERRGYFHFGAIHPASALDTCLARRARNVTISKHSAHSIFYRTAPATYGLLKWFDETIDPGTVVGKRDSGVRADEKDPSVRDISDLGLSVRSYNCLHTARIETVRDLAMCTEAELLRLKHFGRKSLNEIRELLQSMGLQLGMTESAFERALTENPLFHDETDHERTGPTGPLEARIAELDLSVRSYNCLHTARIETVRDLAMCTEAELLRLKHFGRKSLNEIRELLQSMGLQLGMTESDADASAQTTKPIDKQLVDVSDDRTDANRVLAAIPWMAPFLAKLLAHFATNTRATVAEALGTEVTTGPPVVIATVLNDIGFRFFGSTYDSVLDTVPTGPQSVMLDRVHSLSPMTLEQVGSALGVTRERVRQIEHKTKALIRRRLSTKEVSLQARVCRELFGRILSLDAAHQVSRVFIEPSSNPDQAFVALLSLAGPYRIRGGWIIRVDTTRRVEQLRSRLSACADRIGRIDSLSISRETAGLFRREEERNCFLVNHLGLHRIHDEWMIRDSMRSRVFLSLHKLGQPSTKEEIAEHAGVQNHARITSYLGAVDFVCRADKTRWAFTEWVDDPYGGIAAEIEQRIDEDGGRTTVDRIITELPVRFGVSALSVRSYLATPRFAIEDGYVRRATQKEINNTYFGDAEDVQSAVRLKDGTWAIRIGLEESHFKGYSAAIPAPVAWECGLKPGDSLLVPIEGTTHMASLIWRVDNLSKTVDLGRIASVLSELGFSTGDEAIVAPSHELVRLYHTSDAPLAPGVQQNSDTPDVSVESILDSLFTR